MALSNVTDFIGGWIGGCLGILIGQPFDTIKVRQQSLKSSSAFYHAKELIRSEGWRSFYKGMQFPMLFAGIQNSLLFGFYGVAQGFNLNEGSPYLKAFTSGCFGGMGQLIVSCPVDLIKIKMQVQKNNENFACSFLAAKIIFKERGLRGLYQGLGIVAVRDIFASGLYVTSYAFLMDQMQLENQVLKTFTAGGFAGWFSWVCILPLDVVKSRIQSDCHINSKYEGMFHCFKELHKEGGFRIFGRGFLAISLRSLPVNGATFLGYEYTLKLCHNLGNRLM